VLLQLRLRFPCSAASTLISLSAIDKKLLREIHSVVFSADDLDKSLRTTYRQSITKDELMAQRQQLQTLMDLAGDLLFEVSLLIVEYLSMCDRWIG